MSDKPLGPRLRYLKTLPTRYNPIWPTRTRQPLSKSLAEYFFSLLSTSETSLLELLKAHPELPPWNQLNYWRRHQPWFSEAWRNATKAQAHFLVQRSIDLYNQVQPENAHAIRVKFDILKWLSAKFHPDSYGDKPAQLPTNTVVNVGISISPERLTEIRTNLVHTRKSLQPRSKSSNGSTVPALTEK